MYKYLKVLGAVLLLGAVSCSTPQKTVEINGQKVPVKTFTDEQIQADAWALTYMQCENELMKHQLSLDSNNRKLKHDYDNAYRKQKLFFNRMYVRYFQDSVYKHKFLNYQKEGKKLFRPCQQMNAIKEMEKNRKK